MKTNVLFIQNAIFYSLRCSVDRLILNLREIVRSEAIYKSNEKTIAEFIENHYLTKYERSLHNLYRVIPRDHYFDDIFEIDSDKEIELHSLQETIEFFENHGDFILLDDYEIVADKLNAFWKENPNGLIRLC